jgi:hypothetical protein
MENKMTLTKTHKFHLLRLCRKAMELDQAIGIWWLGPYAGKYFITDVEGHRVDTGEIGMSLNGLESWYAQHHDMQSKIAAPLCAA